MKRFLIAAILVCAVVGGGAAPITTHGSCSPALSQVGGNVTITCGQGREDLQQIVRLINDSRRENNLNAAQVRTLLATVNATLRDTRGSTAMIIATLQQNRRASQQTIAMLKEILEKLNAPRSEMTLRARYVVYFDFMKSNLTLPAQQIVVQAVNDMQTNPDYLATIQVFLDTDLGDDDKPLSDEWLRAFGDRRAAAVRDELVRGGIRPERIRILPSTIAVTAHSPMARVAFIKLGEPN